MRDSLDEEDGPADPNRPPPYDPGSRPANRDASPLPAPQPQKPVHPPRESLDGDTIFAVGEEDKWSDDELDSPGPANHDERKRLTGKDD